jgi:hypothetical protein
MADTGAGSSPGASGGFGGALKEKMGPLQTWAWLAIITGAGLLYYLYKKSKGGASGGQAVGAATQAQASPGQVTGAQNVPDYVFQNSTSVTTPPASAPITINNTTPAGTPTEAGPEPTTVSSSPGAYTTGLAGNLDEWTSTGKYSLNTLASSHGMTAAQLLASSLSAENNVGLQSYANAKNYNGLVPAGVHLYYPSGNWKVTGK